MNCPFSAPGRQVACLALMKQREEAMTRPNDDNPCYSCPQRVKRLDADKPAQRISIPIASCWGAGKPVSAASPATPSVPPLTEKKETAVATDMKESVYRQIEKTGSCTQSRITQYTHIKPNELAVIAAELEKEGRIRVWPKGGRNMYSLPGEPDPWAGKRQPAAKPREKAVATTAEPGIGNRKKAIPGAPLVAASTAAPAAKAPLNPIAAALDDLRTRRAQLDAAIAALEVLA